MQYTLRGIPPAVDRALRKKARQAGVSLNEAAVDALRAGLGLAEEPRGPRRDLADVAGACAPDADLDDALADQRRIDEDAWR